MLMSWISGGVPIPNDRKAAAPETGGILAGTMVATEDGWKPVETLCVGDLVMTFDGGLQPIMGVSRALYPALPAALDTSESLIRIPTGLIGNTSPLTVTPYQPLVIESDLSEVLFGDPFAPVEARALRAVSGVEEILPDEAVVVVSLGFEQDQIIFAAGNALVLCPAEMCFKPRCLEDVVFANSEPSYQVLSAEEAHMVAAGILAEHSAGPDGEATGASMVA